MFSGCGTALVTPFKQDLSLDEAETLAPDTLALIRRNLGTDLILLGSYLDLGNDGEIQLNLRLQDTTLGDTTAAWTEAGTESNLKELVQKFVPEAIGREIEKAARSIYPLQNVYVRKAKILKSPKFDMSKLLELHGESTDVSDDSISLELYVRVLTLICFVGDRDAGCEGLQGA